MRIEAVDYHTAGEPFRIVTGGVPPLQGTTVLEQRRFAAERLDVVPDLAEALQRALALCAPDDVLLYGCASYVSDLTDAVRGAEELVVLERRRVRIAARLQKEGT